MIKFNQAVEKIDYGSDNNIRVTVNNLKENKRITYESRQVLSTIPLGILKEQYKNMFSPELPSEKIRAIEKLGFGVMNKFFFVFDQDLPENVNGLQIYWRNDLNFTLDSNKKWNLKVLY